MNHVNTAHQAPKISVIIPAFNAMQFLPETLDSVLQQSYTNIDVIIVNDGSSDAIESWFQDLDDPRIRLINQQNKGLAGARNTGILNAQGQYLSFLDADDLWCPTKLEEQLAVLEDNPRVGLVYTGIANINEAGQLTGRVIQHHIEGVVWEALTQHNFVECGSVAMVRRECFDTCGLFDCQLGSFLEDWDMWLRIAKHYAFKVLQSPLVFYRQHANSASKNWDAMAHSFDIVMAKNFTDPALDHLKRQSYGHFYLYCLAWKPLQSQSRDAQKAIEFYKTALRYHSSLRYTKEYFRLSCAILLMRMFGTAGYDKILNRFYQSRQSVNRFFALNSP